MEETYANHIVLIGWDSFARAVCKQLIAAERFVVVVTNSLVDIQEIKSLYPKTQMIAVSAHREDFDKLRQVGVERAANLFINITDDKEKLIYIFKLRKEFPDCKIVAPVNNPNLKETFVNAAEIHPLSKDEISAKMFASYLFERDVAFYTSDLFATAVNDDDYDIQQFKVTADNPLCGKSYGQSFNVLKKTVNAVLIGMAKPEGETRRLLKNPPTDTPVNEGDYLIVILSGRASTLLEQQFGVTEGES